MNRIVCLVLATAIPFSSSAVVAQTPTARERELEELVRKLGAKVEQLEARIGKVEGATSDAVTQDRVQKLEERVETMKSTTPPPVDTEQWARIDKWMNDGSTLRPYWKDSLRFDSNDGSVKLKIGGRIQNDYTYFAEDGDVFA